MFVPGVLAGAKVGVGGIFFWRFTWWGCYFKLRGKIGVGVVLRGKIGVGVVAALNNFLGPRLNGKEG